MGNANKFNSRVIDPRVFNSYQAPIGDLPVGENLRDSRYQNKTAAEQLPLPLGTQFTTFDGRVFRYVKYVHTADAAEGNLVMMNTPVDVANITSFSPDPGSASAPVTEITDSALTNTINQYAGYYLTVQGGTGVGYTRRISGNDATTFYLEEGVPADLDTDSDLTIWHPYVVILTDAAATVEEVQKVIGVSIGVLTQGDGGAGDGSDDPHYGWVQTRGLCERVIVDAAVTAGYGLVPSPTNDGQALEMVADTNSLALAQQIFGWTFDDAGLAATTGGVPAMLYCE